MDASQPQETGPPDDGMVVILATRDRPAQLAHALAALATATRTQDRVLVVDSASRTDATRVVCEAAGVPVLRMHQPGASRARNAGAAATDAPLLAFTDDDCRPRPGWTAALAAAFGDAAVGLVTGPVPPEEGSGVPVSVLTDLQPRRLAGGEASARHIVGFGHGANMAVRRTAFEQVGGFDEQLGAGALGGCEDQDVFLRLALAGWAAVYDPRAVVGHVAWRTRRQAVQASYRYGCGQGGLATKHRTSLPGLGRDMARQGFVSDGLGAAWRDLRAGYALGTLSGVARAAGVARGLLAR